MIIQHNIQALNSYNRLSGNNSLVSKNLEKLSSGYKINRAGDDAAGLAISEKMRAQITGLTRATQNSQDGISLVQTAEGQLTEVHSMLNRMVDLATQSSNGTIDNDTDRKNIQKEVESLQKEIDRIATSSHFNGIKLLDGSMGGYSMQQTTVNTASFDTGSFVVAGGNINVGDVVKVTYDGAGGFMLASGTILGGITLTSDTSAGMLASFGVSVQKVQSEPGGKAGNYTLKLTVTDPTKANKAMADAIGDGLSLSFTTKNTAAAGHSFTLTGSDKAGGIVAGAKPETAANGGLNLQIGDSADQRVTVIVGNMGTKALGIDGINVGTEVGGKNAIDVIKKAINTVSSTRADLGAIQNRLEHTINNLTTTAENMTAAESRIRDTDMAKEMMAFTKNNVLSQAAQAMLAQANQQPQQVLQLLR